MLWTQDILCEKTLKRYLCLLFSLPTVKLSFRMIWPNSNLIPFLVPDSLYMMYTHTGKSQRWWGFRCHHLSKDALAVNSFRRALNDLKSGLIIYWFVKKWSKQLLCARTLLFKITLVVCFQTNACQTDFLQLLKLRVTLTFCFCLFLANYISCLSHFFQKLKFSKHFFLYLAFPSGLFSR